MVADRFELRLDTELRRRLDELAEERGMAASELVRRLIEEASASAERERRLAAARRIGELQVEEVPDPDELSRQLAGTYDLPDLP